MNRFFLLKVVVGSVILLTGFSSCKSKKVQQTVEVPADTSRCKLDFKNAKVLERHMKEKELKFKTVNGKFSCDMIMNDEESSFNVSVRCRKDSIIWLNISKAAIDAIRMVITKDSVKMMIMTELGGLDKSYFKGDFSYINQKLNADLDYDMVQALLFGNSADFFNDTVNFKAGKDKANCQYLLSTIRKRKLQKIIDGRPSKISYQTIWLNPETWKIEMLEYDDPDTKRKFNACYDDFQQVDSITSMPYKLLYTITAQKIIKAQLIWNRIKLNESVSFPFRIPDSYPAIEFKKKEGEEIQNNNGNNNGTGSGND